MDSLFEMRLFALAVRTGSFSEAGRQMGMSPASVSRHISRLEETLGARLLNRSSRYLSLTQAGELFLERANRILQEVDEIRSAVEDLGVGLHGRLHVHARVLVGRHLIVPLLSRFLEMHPKVDLSLTLSDQPLDLIENGIDITIRSGSPHKQGGLSLVMRVFGSSSRVLCASPDYVQRLGAPSTPEDLTNHACLTYRFDFGQPIWRIQSGEGDRLIKVRSRVQSSDGEGLRLLALQGSGIALLPRWSVAGDIRAGRLVELLPGSTIAPADAPFGSEVYALYQRSRHQAPKLRAFIDLLADEIHTWG